MTRYLMSRCPTENYISTTLNKVSIDSKCSANAAVRGHNFLHTFEVDYSATRKSEQTESARTLSYSASTTQHHKWLTQLIKLLHECLASH